MISEVDIRDWDKVDVQEARDALENIEGFPQYRMEIVGNFITQVELLREKQIKELRKNIPALFKEKNG